LYCANAFVHIFIYQAFTNLIKYLSSRAKKLKAAEEMKAKMAKEEAEKVATALENIQPAPEPKTPDEKPKEAEAKSPEKTTEKKEESDLKAEAEAMHQAECCIIL